MSVAAPFVWRCLSGSTMAPAAIREIDCRTVRSQTPNAEPMVCTPVHVRGLRGEAGENVRVATEPLPDGVRSPDAPIGRTFQLAGVDQAAALPAGEQLSMIVKDRDPAATAAEEPGTAASQRASRPGKRDTLADLPPFTRSARPKMEYQDNRILL